MQMNMDPNGQSPWFTTSGAPDNAYPPMNNSGMGGGAMGVGPGHNMGAGGRMGAPMTPGTFPAPISTSSSMGGDEYQYNDEEDYENEPPLLEGKLTCLLYVYGCVESSYVSANEQSWAFTSTTSG